MNTDLPESTALTIKPHLPIKLHLPKSSEACYDFGNFISQELVRRTGR
jgi:hypothetical protein